MPAACAYETPSDAEAGGRQESARAASLIALSRNALVLITGGRGREFTGIEQYKKCSPTTSRSSRVDWTHLQLVRPPPHLPKAPHHFPYPKTYVTAKVDHVR